MIQKSTLSAFSIGIIGYSTWSLYKIIASFAPDFSVFYHAASNLMHNIPLYTQTGFTIFNYPPISTFFFIPLFFLPFPVAQGLFVTLSYLAAWGCVYICFKLIGKPFSLLSFFVTLALFLMAFPTKFTLGMGQTNSIAYLLLLFAVWFDMRDLKNTAGILLAVSILFKPIFVFLVIYFILKKSWKTIIICIGTGVLLTVSQCIFFPQTITAWQTYLFRVLPRLFTSAGREVYYNQGLLGAISRITPSLFARSIANWVLSLGLLTGILWVLVKAPRQHLFHLAFLLSVLPVLDSLSWQHHFIVLLFPMMYLFYKFKKDKYGLVLLGISYILVSSNIRTPEVFVSFPANLLLSHTLWGTTLLVGLLLYSFHRKRLQVAVAK